MAWREKFRRENVVPTNKYQERIEKDAEEHGRKYGCGVAKVQAGLGHGFQWHELFGNDGVVMFVGGGTAAEETEHIMACVPNLVLPARWNGDGIADFYIAFFIFNAHAPRALSDVIDFFGEAMVMLLRGCAGLETGFSEALVAYRGVSMRKQFTDFRAVLGDE